MRMVGSPLIFGYGLCTVFTRLRRVQNAAHQRSGMFECGIAALCSWQYAHAGTRVAPNNILSTERKTRGRHAMTIGCSAEGSDGIHLR